MFPGRFNTSTFGDKGNKLIKGLEKLKKDKFVRFDVIDQIIDTIKSDQDIWLNEIIRLRDTVAHFETVTDYSYSAHLKGDRISVKPPFLISLNATNNIEIIYNNCLDFVQEFMCLVITMTLPNKFGLRSRGKTHAAVGEPFEQYIKFGLGSY